jgi:signal transduction histidine kinase
MRTAIPSDGVQMPGHRPVPPDTETRLARLFETHALLADIGQELGPTPELTALVTRVLGAMRELVDFRVGTIELVENGEAYLTLSDPPEPAGDEPKSELTIPLTCLGDAIGVLRVDAAEPDAFDEVDRTLLEGLAGQVASAIENARRFEQVMELDRLKRDFIARVSHELRTPVAIVSGFVSTLLAHGDDLAVEQRNHMLQRVDAATTRLAALIEDLIMLSRLETGVVIPRPEVVVLADVLEEVRRTAADPELVMVEVAEKVVVTTDRSLLTRALGLLVDNALKYGGAARIRASVGEILVADEGPGIPHEVQSTLFELFTRGSGTTTVPGLGLGLPMARTLLDVVGARVRVESAAGGGTVVRIELRQV